MTLRPYQQLVVDNTWRLMQNDRESRPLIVLPTGSGKSHVIAKLAHDALMRWGARTLVLTHVKELVEQNADKLRAADSDIDVGVYSAGLKQRDTIDSVIVAGIQSVYKRIPELSDPPFSLVIVDECHTLPPSSDGMYRQALEHLEAINPRCRLIGLTATPFRMTSGLLIGNGQPFTEISHEAGIRELIDEGYLCRPVSRGAAFEAETSELKIRNGDFVAGQMEARFQDIFVHSLNEMFSATSLRRSVLVFCAGVEHAKNCNDFAQGIHESSAIITAQTPASSRDEIVRRFRDGEIRYLFNVGVLTTGFDAPNCDAVVLLRSTMSPGLYVQMIGRGFRLHPGKHDFLVLDFGQNIARHGPIDRIEVSDRWHTASNPAEQPGYKKCPMCQVFSPIAERVCIECGHKFEFKAPYDATPADDEVLSTGPAITYENLDVTGVEYSVHRKRGAPDDHPQSMWVAYKIGYHEVSEWVCIEHAGFAGAKAKSWWRDRSNYPMPETAAEAVELARAGALKTPQWIRVKRIEGERFDSVVGYFFGNQEFPTIDEEILSGAF